jgi:hypothetical protein
MPGKEDLTIDPYWETSLFKKYGLPNEILIELFSYVDAPSLSLFCGAYSLNKELSRLALKELTKKIPAIEELIQATNIEDDLMTGIIDARLFFSSLINKDFQTLTTLLLTHKTNSWALTLWYPVYETRRQLFFDRPALNEHLYLSKKIGILNTPNHNKVKSWKTTNVSMNHATLISLIKQLDISIPTKVLQTELNVVAKLTP